MEQKQDIIFKHSVGRSEENDKNTLNLVPWPIHDKQTNVNRVFMYTNHLDH
jgi:hypothetical protein